MSDASTGATAEPSNIAEFGGFSGDEAKEAAAKQVFVFEVDDELYGVFVEEVGQVLRIPPITNVPNAGPAVMGIFHLRGKVIVAVDLLKCLGLQRKGLFVTNYLFTTQRGKNDYAILFDRPQTVLRVLDISIMPPDPMTAARIGERFIAGVFLYTPPKVRKRVVSDILIQPTPTTSNETTGAALKEEPQRPVVLLRLDEILSDDRVRADASAKG